MLSKKKTLVVFKKWGFQASFLNEKEKLICIKKWKYNFLAPLPKGNKKLSWDEYFHTFSYGLTPCFKNKKALIEYSAQQTDRWFVLISDGYPERIVACSGEKLPNVKKLEMLQSVLQSFADIYLISPSFDWTFCITHEPECGPYFSKPSRGWRTKLSIQKIKKRLSLLDT